MKQRSRPVQEISFSPEDMSEVYRHADAIAGTRNGWINIRPEVDPDDRPREPGPVSGIFAFYGPAVPVGTWIPGKNGRHGIEPDSVGLLHPRGQQLAKRLDDLGLARPPGWRVVQDHPRRGVVFRVPPNSDVHAILAWLVSACETLAAVPLTGRWIAEVHG